MALKSQPQILDELIQPSVQHMALNLLNSPLPGSMYVFDRRRAVRGHDLVGEKVGIGETGQVVRHRPLNG